MNDLLKQFVQTYGPKIETLLVAGVIFALNAVLLAITNDQPNGDVLALVNVFGIALLNYVTSHAREMVLQDTKAAQPATATAEEKTN